MIVASGFAGQDALGHDGGGRRAGARSSPVSSTRKTRSASPSKARPRSAPVSSTRAWRSSLVLGLDRVGRMVRERAVELAEQDLHVETAGRRTTAGTTRPPMPLAVSATTLSGGGGRRSTKERTCSAKRPRSSTARVGRPVGRRAPVGRRPDHGSAMRPLSWPIGPADRQAELDAVVAGGVVRGGEHGAGRVELAGGEVEHVGRGQPDVHDVESLAEHALGEGGHQLDPDWAHVAADDHLRGPSSASEEAPKAAPMRAQSSDRAARAPSPGCRRP